MKKIFLTYTTVALIISGCSGNSMRNINESLSTINNGLSSVNNTLSGSQQTSSNKNPDINSQENQVSFTPTQESKLMASLNQGSQDKNINRSISEATPIITDFIKTYSCYTKFGMVPLDQFAAPGKNFAEPSYVVSDKYHDDTTCVTVARVHGWSMPAKNALQFEVVYISDSSGKSLKKNHEVIKQPNGEWLFNR